MPRQPNTSGGGARTNENGLRFERDMDLKQAIQRTGRYEVVGNIVCKGGEVIATLQKQGTFCTRFLKGHGVDYTKIISYQLKPDETILVGDTLYVIEKKFQGGTGSVDEKLQTCHFKKRQYQRLMTPLGKKVEYFYVLSDWFKQDKYRDVLEYIREVGCDYFFGEIPLDRIGL